MRQLGNATEEANQKMQQALNQVYPLAFGIFETSPLEDQIVADGLLPKESELEAQWVNEMEKLVAVSGLIMPEVDNRRAYDGGRQGQHTEFLAPLLQEMSEVFVIDPQAAW